MSSSLAVPPGPARAGEHAAAWRATPDGPAFSVGGLGRVTNRYIDLDARRDELIISGGVNVYPAEVEAARRCSAVTTSAAAQSRLAPARRRKTYERLEALPRTANGTVRRTELRS